MFITLKDGSKIEVQNGLTVLEIIKKVSEGLARNTLIAKIDDEVVALSQVIEKDCALQVFTFEDELGKDAYRHTTSHILAQAVRNIYPTALLAIGPAIANGFYYDFEFKTPIGKEDLDKLEAEMHRIIKADLPIVKSLVKRAEAEKVLKNFGQTYKLELLNDIPDGEEISFYKQGDFVDLCAGPHLASTGKVKAFKLTSITGAYWRGNEKNKMLTRIYGTSFDKKSALDEYLAKVAEAAARDHNKIGRELNFFMTDENIGQGLPLLMPKGARTIQILQRFVEDEEERRGYLLTKTPIMSKNNLFITSGHWEHYKDKMFVLGDEGVDDEVLCLRPMTCPFQFTIYNNGLKSYRDLPIRYGETATLFRKEASGEMHGLIRIRQFTLSDGHIVCTSEQVEEEFADAVDLIHYITKCLGLEKDLTFRFSRWDPKNSDKYIGTAKDWENTESVMEKILHDLKIDYTEAWGEAAFYGPKLDVQATNVHGKEDTLFTVQVDFALAKRFNMVYIDESGNKVNPIIVHRSSIGCYERTLAMLIEKYAGALPLWMSAEQVKVISLTDRTIPQAKDAVAILKRAGIRAVADVRGEKVGKKIREAQLDKMPYMLIIGDKEAEQGLVSVRHRVEGELGTMTLDSFIEKVKAEIETKK
ncbi:MAG TPA: threonine--tRNA ligase [Clostridia bacterium]|nr:threonine--tRNA ligase [Clostridia bacterium]